MSTFTFTDTVWTGKNRPAYPVISRHRCPRPIQVKQFTIVGHQSSFFRSGDYGEVPALDVVQAALVRSFDPVRFQLVGLDLDWHCRTDICSTFEREPNQPGWNRLEAVYFQGASLYPPLRSTSFGTKRLPGRPWEVTFEVQTPAHPELVKSSTHRVTWLNNLCWHILQRDGPGFGQSSTFPNSILRHITVLVLSEADRCQALQVLSQAAARELGEVNGTDRLTHVDIQVGRLSRP